MANREVADREARIKEIESFFIIGTPELGL
jgi:hypothetical protein